MTPQNLIDFGTTDNRPPVRVRTRRAMILPRLDGRPGHTPAGSEITVSARTLDQLDDDDVLVLGTAPDALAFEI